MNGLDMVALISSDNRVKPGDTLVMSANPDKLHLFDPETTASIVQRQAVAA
jgi:hypothetical protein